ncbi:MAG: hypothetical protein IT308_01810 [Anaerolineaceae bacterium]|nr:hypothetical protein [Anaerolineaceae bacterium]
MTRNTFDVLLLLARPAAGKSEIIHYLRQISAEERLQRFHIGRMDEIDDFPMLWVWFEEDDLLARMGKARLHTTPDGNFKHTYLWDLLIERISLEYHKRLRDAASHPGETTTLIEFARGRQHGGFRRAFDHLSLEVAQRAAILYLRVSYEESLRKNRQRYNPERPDSILQHGLSDEKMERLYKSSDWETLTGAAGQGFLPIRGTQTPYVVFENEDDVTTPGGEPLGVRLEETLGRLWGLYSERI